MSNSRLEKSQTVGSGLGVFGVWAGLLVVELIALSVIYKNLLVFDCRSTTFVEFCLSVSDTPVRAITAFGVLAIFLMTRPEAIYRLLSERRVSLNLNWLLIHFLGLGIILTPLAYLNNSISDSGFLVLLAVWIVGAVAASSGAILTLFGYEAIRTFFRNSGLILAIALLAAIIAPELTQLLQKVWAWQPITDLTFNSVAAILRLGGIELHTVPELKEIGIGEFVVRVGDSCSGLEGVALITIFVTLYITLFRDQLNMKRALFLYPLGILASLLLNVVRINALILIGAYYSPELAINGFHSHAGWLFFMVLSLTLALVANSITWFRKEPAGHIRPTRATAIPFAEDPTVALIFPFIIFMLSALLSDTASETPALFYPLRALAMLAVLYYCRRPILALVWKIDPIAVGAGLMIAAIWLFASPQVEPDWQEALYALPAPILALWIVSRIIGTTLLVPVIEELFFRGYILSRFLNQGSTMMIIGFALSSGLFAAMHGRWVLAAIAGLIFAGLYARRERLSDPIVAHVVANGCIAAAALIGQNWALI